MTATLRESRSLVNTELRESRNPLVLQYIRANRMDKSGQELLRENIRRRLGRRTQRSLARAIGVGDATISDFLNGRQHSLDLDLYLPIAKFLGCSVAELFSPTVTTSVLDHNAEAGVSSAPTALPGDVDHALARLLQQSDTIDQDDALRHTIIQIAHQLIALVARPKKARRTPRKKARGGGRD